jgi:phospholipase C
MIMFLQSQNANSWAETIGRAPRSIAMKTIKYKLIIFLPCVFFVTAFAQTKFQHIIVIVQENRTPDNLFQGLCGPSGTLCPSSYDISRRGVTPSGKPVTLTPVPLPDDLDPDHSHNSFTQMYNNGGFNQGPTAVHCTNSPYCCGKFGHPNAASCEENGAMVYNWMHRVSNDLFTYAGKQYWRLNPYLQLAKQYGWANYFFQTNQGASFPAHQFLFGGTSAPTAPPNNLFVSENPGQSIYYRHTGCTADKVLGALVPVIDPSGNEHTNPPVYPCFERQTLADLLDSAGLTWKYYATSAGGIWTAPNAILHICDPVGNACAGPDWTQNVQPYLGPGKVIVDLGVNGKDITACQLPALSWVIPDGRWSDHAGTDPAAFGPAWVGDIVDAVGGYDNQGVKLPVQCGYWKNTAILITWDDWGGWYDHVQPFKVIMDGKSWGSGYVYGFRVPFLFVSAYTPMRFVSGTVSRKGDTCSDLKHCYDFGSILRFIESNFGLGQIITGQYHYADFYAKPLDTQFYSGTERAFVPIPTPVPLNCFIDPHALGCFPSYAGPMEPDNDGDEN